MTTEMPSREVKAEEMLHCEACKKQTKHRYEVISFHTKVMFVKLFCHKKRYVRICEECNNGVDITEEEFEGHIERLTGKTKKSEPKKDLKRFEYSRKSGIRYCNQCGEKIYPDVGYCTSCAVRSPASKKKKPSPSSTSRSSRNKKKTSARRKSRKRKT